MNCGLARILVLGISIFGVVQLRLGHIGLMKENWTQEQLAAILLDTRKDQGVSSFIVHLVDLFLRQGMLNLLRMLKMVGVLNSRMLSFRRNVLIFL